MRIKWSDFNDRTVQRGVSLMRAINKLGYQAYVVGGCVRDIVMWYRNQEGDPSIHDVDLATNMPIPLLQKTFRTEDNGGEKHGTILVFWEGEPFEVTQFRVDGDYSDGRHADSVSYTNSFEEDTKRRDFTINAMGIDADGEVIDYHGGVDDLNNGVIRAVGNASDRFAEDGLRIIRAMRFAARFNMEIAEDTLNGITENKANLNNIAMERVHDEFIKSAAYGAAAFAQVVELLTTTGCCDVIDPQGLVDWGPASDMTSMHAKRMLFKELDKDTVMSLIFLFYHTDNYEAAARYFRCTNDDLKVFSYVYSNFQNYRCLVMGTGDTVDKVNIVRHPSFPRLQEFAFGIADIRPNENVEQYRAVAKSAVSRIKELTGALAQNGVKSGPMFGKKLHDLQLWFYDQYLAGNQPNSAEIDDFIKRSLL